MNDRIRTKLAVIPKSFTTAKDRIEWKPLRYVITHMEQLPLFFVIGIYILARELRAKQNQIYGWLLIYLVFLLIIKVLIGARAKLYGATWIRMAGIQTMLLLVSTLIFLTGGVESYFWFIYLWPLSASVFFFPWFVTWGIYGEVVVLYFLASLAVTENLTPINSALFLTNMFVLFLLAALLRFLTEGISKHTELLRSLVELYKGVVGNDNDLYLQIVDTVHHLTKCPVAIWQVDETSTCARIIASRGLRIEYTHQAVADLGQNVIGEAIQRQESIQILDVQSDPRFQDKDEAASEGWQSMLTVPLSAGPNHTIGTLNIYSKTKSANLTHWESDTVRIFASQAGIAIRFSNLMKQERALRQQSEILREAFGAISSSLELEEVAERILDELAKIIEYSKASIQLIRGDGRELLTGRGFDKEITDPWFLRSISDDKLISRIVTSKEPLILSDPTKDPDWGEHTGTADVKSWIGLPLVYEEEIIGLLTLDHNRQGFYTPTIKDLLISFADQAAADIQKARIFDRAQRRIQDLEIINNILQIIGMQLDTQGLMHTIVSQIAKQLHCSHCAFFSLKEEDGEHLLAPLAIYDISSKQIPSRRFKPGEGLVGWVFQKGKSLVLDDARSDPRFAPAREERSLPRPMLVAPVRIGDQTVGVISAEKGSLGQFSEGDRCLVDTLARQAGIAIERATALELLRNVGNQIISAPEIDIILRQIVSGAIKLTNTNTGVIYLVSEDGKSVTHSFFPPGFEHPRPRLSRKEGLTHQVIKTGRELKILDIHNDSRVNPVLRNWFRSMIAVPLKRDKGVIGVLYLNDEDFHDFSETEVSLLSALANQAAIAIEKAELIDDLQERNQILTSLHKTGSSILSTVALEEVLNQIAKNALEVLQADIVTVYKYDEEQDDILVPPIIQGKVRHPEITRDRGVIVPHRESVVFKVIRKGKPVYGSNVKIDWVEEGFLSLPSKTSMDSFVIREGIVSSASIPLKARDTTVGVMFINYRQVQMFTPTEKDNIKIFSNQAAIAIQNASLMQAQKRRITELASLLETSRALVSSPVESRDVLQRIVDNARGVLRSDFALVFPYDSKNGEFQEHLITTSGITEKQALLMQGPRVNGMAVEVLDKGVVYVDDVRDAKKYPFVRRGSQSIITQAKVRSLVGICLQVGDEPIGVLYAGFCTPRYLSTDAMNTLQLFANHAAIAIQNARLFERTQRHVNELSVLNQISQNISSGATLEIEDVLELVYQQTTKLMDVRNFYIAFYNEKEEQVSFRFAIEDGQPEEIGIGQFQDRKSGNGLTEYVIRSKRPVLIKKDAEEWLSSHKVERIGLLAKSWLGAPMIAREKVLGVIGIQNYEIENAYDEDHQDILMTIASQAAIAIQNATLLREREQELDHLATLYEKLNRLSYRSISLIGAGSYGSLVANVEKIVRQEWDAEAVLYRCTQVGSNIFKLVPGSESNFKSILKEIWCLSETPLKPKVEKVGIENYHKVFACNEAEGVEGILLIQRKGVLEQPDKPFDNSDKICFLLLSSAIGHTLKRLRIQRSIQPSS